MTPEYRTPDEYHAHNVQRARIRLILDNAISDGAMVKTAICLAEPAHVVDLWVDRLWNRLRDALTDDIRGCEDRLAAIILLLEDRMSADAAELLQTIREAGDA